MTAMSLEGVFAGMFWWRRLQSIALRGLTKATRGFHHGRVVFGRIEVSIGKRTEEVFGEVFPDLGGARKPNLISYFGEYGLERTELVGLIGAFCGVTIHSRPLSYWGGSGPAFNDGALRKCRPCRYHTLNLANVESRPEILTTAVGWGLTQPKDKLASVGTLAFVRAGLGGFRRLVVCALARRPLVVLLVGLLVVVATFLGSVRHFPTPCRELRHLLNRSSAPLFLTATTITLKGSDHAE